MVGFAPATGSVHQLANTAFLAFVLHRYLSLPVLLVLLAYPSTKPEIGGFLRTAVDI